MPLAHACPACGHVLTHVRADYVRDFRAPVVVCPECTFAAVRRRHPIAAAMRLWWRRAWAAYGLAWRGVLTSVLAIGTTILVAYIGDELDGAGLGVSELGAQLIGIHPRDAGWDHLFESGGHVMLIIGACWAALVGAVLTGGLSHLRRRWVPWPLFLALVVLCIWTPTAFAIWESLSREDGLHQWDGSPTYRTEAALSTKVLLALFPVMLLGTPLGVFARRAILQRETRRFARKRAYLMARRTHS